jgi:hypothetical protein
MRKFAIVFLAAAGICGPFAANATLVQNSPVAPNTPPMMSVSGATVVSSNLPHQIAHLNGEVSTLQQQVQTILQQPAVTSQASARLYPDSVGG